MAWKVTTPATEEPITLVEAKLHLRVDHSDEDTLITSLIKAAREYCENVQNRSYITQAITLNMDDFPDGDEFELPRAPLISVTSVKYVDESGIQQTLSTDVYQVDTKSEPGKVKLKYNQSWPGVRGDYDGIEVIYTAGYGAASAVPENIKAAIKLLVGHFYAHREAAIETSLEEIPLGIHSLLSLDRIGLV